MEFNRIHEKMLTDIHEYIKGSELHPKGSEERMCNAEEKIDKHDVFLKVLSGIMVIIVGAISLLGTIAAIIP